jgi:predicted HTH domain antitoxin
LVLKNIYLLKLNASPQAGTLSPLGIPIGVTMKIEIDDDIARKCQLTEREALELLAMGIYKSKGIHGAMAGRLLGISEAEFHQLLASHGGTVNYSLEDLMDDVHSNGLA